MQAKINRKRVMWSAVNRVVWCAWVAQCEGEGNAGR